MQIRSVRLLETVTRLANLNPLIALIILLCTSTSCNVIFYKDANNFLGGSWLGQNAFIEIQNQFQRKASWNPLNQNAITKNYETTLLLHNVDGTKVTSTKQIAHFKGWTLNDSLFVVGQRIILIRGLGDGYGDWNREVVILSMEDKSEPAVINSSSNAGSRVLLAAIPSPDGKWLAVFTTDSRMEKRTDNLFLTFYAIDASGATEKNSVTIRWTGVPGNPELSWAKDSSRLFLHLENSVVEATVTGKESKPVHRFPKCFVPTSTGRVISDAGLFFSRSQPPEQSIEIKKTEEQIRFAAIPMTESLQEIGAGCP